MEVRAKTRLSFLVRSAIWGSRPGSTLAMDHLEHRHRGTETRREARKRPHMLKKISGMAMMYFKLMVQRRIILMGRATIPSISITNTA